MDKNNHDFDKTTIRVELSDAYQDIIIDWSKEMDDIVKEMFRQMAEFTGMPIEKTWAIIFIKPPIGNGVHPENPFFDAAAGTAYFHFDNSDLRPLNGNSRYTKEDIRYKFFGDDNCFALNTNMDTTLTMDRLDVNHLLVHRDLIDETECNMFCHHSSNRAFLDKQAKIMNSNIETYLRDQPRPFTDNIDEIYLLDNPMHDVFVTRKREILADLNIGQYFDSYCKILHSDSRPRIYWPNRG
ncbi:uncharacterized protein LOC107368388 isoform X2 [Tetranychus urticae]|uniref:uncharacterized protein LOC107368388 isoform X2 n=1 Tax=Tetranychus urticae TaxID=32264 RepID=UPI00077BCDF9|nr:uncharacterized protein LOC107368388 isoform X2 [Tetranychus urticae]XP_015791690.1 uncharacterized protein LOC107368388 isoform X2 [Tetranychus urticae]XP_015791691.1 uncharacterized protein LOC107368388 isoform X2 [Tetranychus urticae]